MVVLSQLLSVKFSNINRYADDITLVSYLLVMALGAFLFLTALVNQLKRFKYSAIKHTHLVRWSSFFVPINRRI